MQSKWPRLNSRNNWHVPHGQRTCAVVINVTLCFSVFMSYSVSPPPPSHALTLQAATLPIWEKCQHLLCCNSFRLRPRSHVTTVENHCDWISKPTAGIVWLNDRGLRLTLFFRLTCSTRSRISTCLQYLRFYQKPSTQTICGCNYTM